MTKQLRALTPHEKLRHVQGLLSASESGIGGYPYVLHSGNLYFKGNVSSFLIRNFLQSDVNAELTSDMLNSILAIGKDVRITEFAENTLRAQTEAGLLSMGANPPTVDPQMMIMPYDEMIEPDIRLIQYRQILNVQPKQCDMNLVNIASIPCIVASSRSLIAVARHGLQLEMCLSPIRMQFLKALELNMKLGMVRPRILHMSIDNQLINACANLATAPHLLAGQTVESLERLINRLGDEGSMFENSVTDPPVTLQVASSEFAKQMATFESLSPHANIRYTVGNGRLELSAHGSMGKSYTGVVNCNCSNAINFTSRIISTDILAFINSSGEQSDPITITATSKRMIITKGPCTIHNFAFVLTTVTSR